MKPFTLERLAVQAEKRPAGYTDAVLALATVLPDGRYQLSTDDYAALLRKFPPGAADRLAIIGPKLWAKMYARALTPAADRVHTDSVFLANIRAGLPCGPCRAHFNAYVAAHPPEPFTFGWVAAFHNAVNAIRGVEIWTIELARKRWDITSVSGESAQASTGYLSTFH